VEREESGRGEGLLLLLLLLLMRIEGGKGGGGGRKEGIMVIEIRRRRVRNTRDDTIEHDQGLERGATAEMDRGC